MKSSVVTSNLKVKLEILNSKSNHNPIFYFLRKVYYYVFLINNMIREHWFPTCIYYEKIKLDFNKMLDYCYDLQRRVPGVKKSNINGYQSPPIHNDFNFKELVEKIEELAKEPFKDLYPGRKGEFKMNNMWININSKFSSNDLHFHPRSDLSGCFYLKNNSNGEIYFEDPRIMTRINEVDDMTIQNELTFVNVHYNPVQGQILFFPSWLRHKVGYNENDSDRISIAFNLSLKFYD